MEHSQLMYALLVLIRPDPSPRVMLLEMPHGLVLPGGPISMHHPHPQDALRECVDWQLPNVAVGSEGMVVYEMPEEAILLFRPRHWQGGFRNTAWQYSGVQWRSLWDRPVGEGVVLSDALHALADQERVVQ